MTSLTALRIGTMLAALCVAGLAEAQTPAPDTKASKGAPAAKAGTAKSQAPNKSTKPQPASPRPAQQPDAKPGGNAAVLSPFPSAKSPLLETGISRPFVAADASDPNADSAYAAYQRGFFLTALSLATQRAETDKDPKAMTLIGEIYANGRGVPRDDARALAWYDQAAALGERNAIFALAMFKIAGRGAAADRDEAARLLADAAKRGHAVAAYDLALLYLEGNLLAQDFKRAAELMRQAADAGNPEAQYALATLYKEGRGVEKDLTRAARLLRASALADNVDATVEFAIALFNGIGIDKDEATAVAMLRKAAAQGSPIAQNRLARVLATGRGAPMDTTEALKWHLIAKSGGAGDPILDDMLSTVSGDQKARAEAAARRWNRTPR
jgi:TPR repeat protein